MVWKKKTLLGKLVQLLIQVAHFFCIFSAVVSIFDAFSEINVPGRGLTFSVLGCLYHIILWHSFCIFLRITARNYTQAVHPYQFNWSISLITQITDFVSTPGVNLSKLEFEADSQRNPIVSLFENAQCILFELSIRLCDQSLGANDCWIRDQV